MEVNVEIPDEVEGDSETVPCHICKKRFINTQSLATHKLSSEKKCSDSFKSVKYLYLYLDLFEQFKAVLA